jgi:cytosine/uracil/thiamine/allantoin permease
MVESSKASVDQQSSNPALQPLDDRKLRRVHHGQTGAMWTAVTVLMVGFIVGGIAMVLGPNWILFAIACLICVLGIAAGLVLRALGFGVYEVNGKKKNET